MNAMLALPLEQQKSTTVIRAQGALFWNYLCDCWSTANLPYFPLTEDKKYDSQLLNKHFPIPAETGVLTFATASELRSAFLWKWNSYVASKDRVNQYRVDCGKQRKLVAYTPERIVSDGCSVPFMPKHWYRRKYDDALKLLTRDQACYVIVPMSKTNWKWIDNHGILESVYVGSEYTYLQVCEVTNG